MRKLLIVVALTIGMLGALAPAADASVYCRVLEKLGYEWVRECEAPL